MKNHEAIRSQRITQSIDAYKPSMAQLAYESHPDTQVTFELKNRRTNQRLADYIDVSSLQTRLETFRHGIDEDELVFLASQMRKGDQGQLFDDEFLAYLLTHELPEIQVNLDDETNDISVTTTGDWPLVTFWETIVMSEINEMYFEGYIQAHGLSPELLYEEGDARLTQKIAVLKTRPDIKFADFGTRRRFSYRWHKHVVSRLASECPDNLIGTSNVWLAKEFSIVPIGTFAHEMPMVYAALAYADGRNPLDGHAEMLSDWQNLYADNLSTALTDTFTTDFFFADFSAEQAHSWQGLRQDSGDPIAFGEKAIEMYRSHGIDPNSKTIVFSDSLDIDTIVKLADHFAGRIQVVFGWGTDLTNDLGLPALNIVMKATRANGTPTVKLSDDPGKAMGPNYMVQTYIRATSARKVLAVCE